MYIKIISQFLTLSEYLEQSTALYSVVPTLPFMALYFEIFAMWYLTLATYTIWKSIISNIDGFSRLTAGSLCREQSRSSRVSV